MSAAGPNIAPSPRTGWAALRDLNGYHWFVFVVAALGWLADCLDQQLFNLVRRDAVIELLKVDPATKDGASQVAEWAGYSTSIFLIGWGAGGIAFGILGDRWGRVKTMLLTILMYSVFTGLSALSTSVYDFAFYRFLTGLGVGGEFAVGVALVAEVMPGHVRPYMLGLLQAFSAIGNVTAALLYMWVGYLHKTGSFQGLYILGYGPITPWRGLFIVGMLPALIALLVRRRLKEPERWREATAGDAARRAGSYAELFGNPRWRRNALLGLMLAFAGVVGLWGIAFFVIDLQKIVFDRMYEEQGLFGSEKAGTAMIWAGITSIMINVGAFIGMTGFSTITAWIGRRPTFAIAFVAAAVSTIVVFLFLDNHTDLFWMLPIMGLCQLSLFGGYAIYFPELFPTHLRSTGTSFCYNVGRFVAAAGPTALGLLTSQVFAGYAEPMRYAGVTMCAVYLVGLAALPFLPETKGQPLPE